MDELIAILKDIHPDVDYETATNLVDGKILYQEVSKITAENMEDYREYIISAN